MTQDIAAGWVKPSRSLLTLAGRAIGDWRMIRNGDRILLGLSGGKDSLSLLHTLHHLQQKAPVKFELLACTVDPQTDDYNPKSLVPYLAGLGVPYFLESQPIMRDALKTLTKDSDSYCAYGSRMRRGILYRIAREQNCNVVAMAHHLDDLAETLMMSMLFGGKLRTMSPHYLNDAGDLRIIRPFAYARERQTRAFAVDAELPVISDNCPCCFAKPQQRYAMKQMLAEQEKAHPRIFNSMLTAMKPLMGEPPPG
ncbi:MAG: ATP-binding protein [Thiobacillus sp.]|nr:ATP-binding protein [Thiobacillus sp.]